MANKTAFQIQTRRDAIIDRRPIEVDTNFDLPEVPVMPETLLLLDLLVQESCVDLRQMSYLVLADIGASLQILRLAGREYGAAEDRPTRIADCISDLGLRPCLKALSAQTLSRHGHEIAAFWDHAREIADQAKLVAQEMVDVDPEEAYLVALFHMLGSVPALLGWREPAATDHSLAGLRLAKRWSLPNCVIEFFGEMQLPGYDGRWLTIVRKAHARANRTPIRCPFEGNIRPQLCREGRSRLDPEPSR